MASFDLAACLRWTRLDAREAARDLKMILEMQDFRTLFSGVAEAGFWRGLDADGNTVTVRVVAA